MDYEKAYKAVLKTATQWIKDGCTDKERICLESVFPELKESGDERMIKAIEYILYENYSDAAVIEGVEIAEIVTWLEELKEPIDPFDTKLFQDGVKEGRRLEREDIMKERQPAEWSETDENNRRNLMSLLANMRGDRITEETYRKYYPWLKDLHPSWKPSEVCYGAKGDPDPAGVWKPSEKQPQVADVSKMVQPEGCLEYWLEHFGMPKENIENCADQIAQGYGASRYLEGVQAGAEAVYELGKQEKGYEQPEVEGIVHPDDCEIWVNLVGYGYKFNDGDKVRVIIVKEDKNMKRNRQFDELLAKVPEETKRLVEKQMTCKWLRNGEECGKGLPGTPCIVKGCVAWEHYREDEK